MAPKSMSSRPGYPLQYDEKPVLSALRSDNAMFAIQITKKTVPSSLLPRWQHGSVATGRPLVMALGKGTQWLLALQVLQEASHVVLGKWNQQDLEI
jgi:hypothetical protein